MIQKMWFNIDRIESLADIYLKYAFLDFKNDEVSKLIDNECIAFLSTKLFFFEEDINYFQYDLNFDKKGDMITILPNNILCALWFVGVFPLETKKVLKSNYFENKKFIFNFDNKKSKLNVKSK